MGQVFGLLGVKGSVVGYLGSEVNWFGERFADLRIRGQARNYVQKKKRHQYLRKWSVIPLKYNYGLFL